MAVLVIEDGSGKANSNSYVTEAELTTYATDRGVTLTAADDAAKAILLIQAMDYIESLNFKGDKATESQALQWPRVGVMIDGYYVDSDEIPELLKQAQMENAIGIDSGVNPLANVPRETIKEKVGDIEVEYSSGALSQTYLKAAETKAAKLVKSKGFAYRV